MLKWGRLAGRVFRSPLAPSGGRGTGASLGLGRCFSISRDRRCILMDLSDALVLSTTILTAVRSSVFSLSLEAVFSSSVFANSFHKTIKFTEEHSTTSVVFLDCTIIRENDRLHTNLHVKDTATHSYVTAESCHPRHIIQKGPYSQFLRLRRNCYKDADFEKHMLQT